MIQRFACVWSCLMNCHFSIRTLVPSITSIRRTISKPRVRSMTSARGLPRRDVMRRTIVILHPGGLGDLLLAVPAVQSLRSRFPAHDVVVCGHDEASRFLAECGLVDHSLPVHTTACAPLFAGRTPDDPLLVDWLGRCDRAVAWTKDDCGTLSAVLKRSGAVESVVQSPFAATLTGVHQSERYAEILGVEAGQVPVVDIALPEALKGEARELLASCGFSHEQRLALVHPGSGSRHKCAKPEILGRVLGGLQAQGFE